MRLVSVHSPSSLDGFSPLLIFYALAYAALHGGLVLWYPLSSGVIICSKYPFIVPGRRHLLPG